MCVCAQKWSDLVESSVTFCRPSLQIRMVTVSKWWLHVEADGFVLLRNDLNPLERERRHLMWEAVNVHGKESPQSD